MNERRLNLLTSLAMVIVSICYLYEIAQNRQLTLENKQLREARTNYHPHPPFWEHGITLSLEGKRFMYFTVDNSQAETLMNISKDLLPK